MMAGARSGVATLPPPRSGTSTDSVPFSGDPEPDAASRGHLARLMTAQDVARYLRCSTKTVLALVRHEGLPGFRLRSRLRFVPGDVLQWARRRGKEVYR
jgi:excisionase family DNA binding protein